MYTRLMLYFNLIHRSSSGHFQV